ncbi:MAG: EAL domain-containing protein [Acidimicrobiales bacterium]|nr:EAL domain-containing protein [Acidimicrobiales bacterium]
MRTLDVFPTASSRRSSGGHAMGDPISIATRNGGEPIEVTRRANEVIVLLDTSGRATGVDPAVRWSLGYRPEDLEGIEIADLVHRDDRLLFADAFQAATAAGQLPDETVKPMECRLRLSDGSHRWFEVLFEDQHTDLNIRLVTMRLRDIHDRREAQAALQAKEERFRAVVQHSYDAIVLSDDRNVIVYATPAIHRLFGWEPEDLIGREGFEFVHPEDLGRTRTQAKAILSQPGGQAQIEFRIRRKDGTYRWVECTSVNLLDHPHVQSIVNSFRDIEDRRRAEEALRASEERLTALLRNADGAILISDPDGVVTWTSPSAERLWGWEEGSMIGRAMADYIHPDDRREVARQFQKMTSTAHGSVRVEGRMQHADGSWRWYEAVFTNCLDDPAVNGIVANIRDTTERALTQRALRDTEEQLEFQATHDPLTELPNRLLFFDRLEVAMARSRRNGTATAVLFMDLDHFKVVNDSQGHGFGDQLLIAVGHRIQGALRQGDSLARFGGDEFVVLCEDLRDEHEAQRLAQDIQRALNEPFNLGETETFVNVSIGIALTDGTDAEPADIVRDAHAAMHQAKERGRGRSEVFDTFMRTRAVERHQLETALRRAVARRQLQVHYQPIVDLRTGRISGVEALVRWKHPTRGLLYPSTFITIAEETGLIVTLGAWIFDAACCEVAHWADLHPEQRDLDVHINLSARQLSEQSLTDDIANVLAATPVDPRHVHVEITESVLVRDIETTRELIARLKVLGLQIAIDDFGTGYSSFSHLTQFPVDTLKIDRSFVQRLGRDEQAPAIVGAIIDLSHTLGLDTVAEGVENATQLAELRKLGCHRAQGYYFAGALPPRKLHDLLRRNPVW